MGFASILGAALLTAGVKSGAKAVIGGGGSKVKATMVAPQVTRNIAAERAALSDNLARRTGQRANRRTRYGGAEATTGTTTSLLGRTGS